VQILVKIDQEMRP